MENYSIHLPAYSVGTDVYGKMKDLCTPYGRKVFAVGGHRALAAAKEKIAAAAEESGLEILDFVWYGGEASYENVDMLAANEKFAEADMVFAIGGGKAMDTGKTLGLLHGKPVFTFPTIASNCAATTAVTIIYHPDGSIVGPHFMPAPPVHAFIDTEIQAKAPDKYLWAGMGDTYAKYYEASVSSRGEKLPHYLALGVAVSRSCVDPILEYGAKAMEENKAGIPGPAFEQAALTVEVTTGIASILLTAEYTPHYNSGLAHAIFYAMTDIPHFEDDHLHGAVVGFGILALLLVDSKMLEGEEKAQCLREFEKIRAFNESVDLPVRVSQLGLTEEQLEHSIDLAILRNDIEHYPYVVTKEMLTEALNELR